MQPLSSGITVMVAEITELPEFWAMNEGIFPVPEAGSPMATLSFVQL